MHNATRPHVPAPAAAGPRSAAAAPVRRRRHRLGAAGAALLVAGAGLVWSSSPASASTITVTTAVDGAPGSLRDAIAQANLTPEHDTIEVPAGVYDLTVAPTGSDGNDSGDLWITTPMDIVGAGAGVTTIDAKGIDRVLTIDTHDAVALRSLTLTGGVTPDLLDAGGNVSVQRVERLTIADAEISNGRAHSGGGVSSPYPLDVVRSTFVGNEVASVPGYGSYGGAISANGPVTIDASTFRDNVAVDGGGGALYLGTADHAVRNVTFVGNHGFKGGAIEMGEAGSLAVVHATFADNAVDGSEQDLGPAVHVAYQSRVTVAASLFAGNANSATPARVPGSCATQQEAVITSLGGNVADDASCVSFGEPTDRLSDPGIDLQPLAGNGGPTATAALATTSSAVDAAPCDPSVTVDQRGEVRPSGARCDAGAFESQGAVAPPTTEPPVTLPPVTEPPAPEPTVPEPTVPAPADPDPAGSADPDPTVPAPAAPEPTTPEATTTVPPDAVAPAALPAPVDPADADVAGDRDVVVTTSTGTLPVTGSSAIPVVVFGAGLVLAGAAATAEARRRRRAG